MSGSARGYFTRRCCANPAPSGTPISPEIIVISPKMYATLWRGEKVILQIEGVQCRRIKDQGCDPGFFLVAINLSMQMEISSQRGGESCEAFFDNAGYLNSDAILLTDFIEESKCR